MTALQAVLNAGGYVLLTTPGVYQINATLKVPSNTRMELGDGVTIQLANGSSTYMLENADQVNGNSNIELIGGTWDANQANNPATGSYPS